MQTLSFDQDGLDLYRGLLATVIQSRIQMDLASARADLLLNIFLISVKNYATVDVYVERTLDSMERELFEARDAPEHLRAATADVARAVWAYQVTPTSAVDRVLRDMFERWESVYVQAVGEFPGDSYMDLENDRCMSDPDYNSQQPLPFPSRAHPKFGNQN